MFVIENQSDIDIGFASDFEQRMGLIRAFYLLKKTKRKIFF